MHEHSLEFSYQARYYQQLPKEMPAARRWLACHGYGQLARFFLRHFHPLQESDIEVVAPEALSHFYLEGSQGRVGASWMTRENREVAIRNYLHFLDTVLKNQENQLPLTLFGFSQGCATVCRYLMHTREAVSDIILWAGVFPPDLDLKLSRKRLQNCRLTLVWGEEDPYFTEVRCAEQEALFRELQIPYELIRFSGGHTLNAEILQLLAGRSKSTS